MGIQRAATGQRQAAYRYNALGERVKKLSTSLTYYHYDLDGRLLAETDAGGETCAEYLYLGSEPLALGRSGQLYYYHNNHLGTPQKLTDGDGNVVWAASYRAFGEESIRVGYVTQNLRFPGQYYDAGMGMHYNYFGDYDPRVGRYLQSDPIGLRGGVNTYGYVENNPFRYIDPLGLNPNKMKQRHRNIESITNLLDYTYCQWNPGACLFRCVRWRCSRESECGVTEYYYIGESDPYAVSPGYNPKEDKNCVCVKECFQGQANCAGR